MEFRQVVQSVCRSAAAAGARPPVARIRPTPSAILMHHHQHSHAFTTNSKQQSDAAAAAAAQPEVQPQQPSPAPQSPAPQSPLHRVAQLRAAYAQNPSSIPPRPPAAPRGNFFIDSSVKKSPPSWTTPGSRPGSQPQQTGNAAAPAATTTRTGSSFLTGTAPATMGEDDNILSLPGQIEADMDAAVGGAGGAGLDPWDEAAFMTQYFGPATTELRLRPSTGRTIHIKGAVDVARGFSLLQRAVGHNRVRRDLNAQRFHERPALKRKRLLRERWRERFKTGFRAVVSRAMELKAQGW